MLRTRPQVNDNDYVVQLPSPSGHMLGLTDDTYTTRYSYDLGSFSRVGWKDDLVPRLHQAKPSLQRLAPLS